MMRIEILTPTYLHDFDKVVQAGRIVEVGEKTAAWAIDRKVARAFDPSQPRAKTPLATILADIEKHGLASEVVAALDPDSTVSDEDAAAMDRFVRNSLRRAADAGTKAELIEALDAVSREHGLTDKSPKDDLVAALTARLDEIDRAD